MCTAVADSGATPAWAAQAMKTCRSRAYAARVFVEPVVANHAARSTSIGTGGRRGAAMAEFCQLQG